MSKNTPRPSVDLGYPTEPHGRIPAFNSIEEEAEFWDTHDFTDFRDLTEPVELTVGPELRRRKPVPSDRSTGTAENVGKGTP
jgi:hypothetical protein